MQYCQCPRCETCNKRIKSVGFTYKNNNIIVIDSDEDVDIEPRLEKTIWINFEVVGVAPAWDDRLAFMVYTTKLINGVEHHTAFALNGSKKRMRIAGWKQMFPTATGINSCAGSLFSQPDFQTMMQNEDASKIGRAPKK
jgi:hypothetical protein